MIEADLLFILVMSVDILKATTVDKIPSDLEGMEASMEHLLALIDDIYKYVDDVVVWCAASFYYSLYCLGLYWLIFHHRKGVLHQTTKLGNLYQMQ